MGQAKKATLSIRGKSFKSSPTNPISASFNLYFYFKTL